MMCKKQILDHQTPADFLIALAIWNLPKRGLVTARGIVSNRHKVPFPHKARDWAWVSARILVRPYLAQDVTGSLFSVSMLRNRHA